MATSTIKNSLSSKITGDVCVRGFSTTGSAVRTFTINGTDARQAYLVFGAINDYGTVAFLIRTESGVLSTTNLGSVSLPEITLTGNSTIEITRSKYDWSNFVVISTRQFTVS